MAARSQTLEQSMGREYEIFECLVDGSIKWCDHVSDLQDARSKLHGLIKDEGNEYFAMHLSSREMIFAGDPSAVVPQRDANRIFQIAYSDQLRLARHEMLRSLDYAVISVVGNDAAKLLLTTLRREDLGIALFIVGHAAPVQTRKEMIDWLKENYPKVRILALNPSNQPIPEADYNVEQNGQAGWMPLVASVLSTLRAS
jgi:hypothetical protein